MPVRAEVPLVASCGSRRARRVGTPCRRCLSARFTGAARAALVLLLYALAPVTRATAQRSGHAECKAYSRSAVLAGLSAAPGARTPEVLARARVRIARCDADPAFAVGEVWRLLDVSPEIEADLLLASADRVSSHLAIVLADIVGEKSRDERTRFAPLAALVAQVTPRARFLATQHFARVVADTNVVAVASAHSPKRSEGDTLSTAATSHVRALLTSLVSSDPSERIRQGARFLLRQERLR